MTSSAEYYIKKEKIKKKFCEKYQNRSGEEKNNENENLAVNDIRISQKMSTEKKINEI